MDISPEVQTAILIGMYVLGVLLRIAWPYLLAYLNDGVKFDWKYLIGQLIGGVIGLFGIIAGEDFIQELGAAGYFGALVLGYGAASIGRDGQKTVKRS